jgi:hypothetical protein
MNDYIFLISGHEITSKHKKIDNFVVKTTGMDFSALQCTYGSGKIKKMALAAFVRYGNYPKINFTTVL